MLARLLIGTITFALTLFASTANDEVDAPVQRLGESYAPAPARTQAFLCDSVQAEDCFLMYASQHPLENATAVPPTKSASRPSPRFKPVACTFGLAVRGERCRAIERSP